MTSSRSKRFFLLASLLVFLLGSHPSQALARAGWPGEARATLLTGPVRLSRGEAVIGVVAAGLFAFPVDQQRQDQPVSVTTSRERLTQFGMAAELGNIGLLAHNHLAGADFFKLQTGQRIYAVFESGRVERFIITRILRFQALTPHSANSDFREVGGTSIIPANEMFALAYSGSYHLTFQTCIEQDGEKSWGRLFVIAEPLAQEP